MEQEQGMTRRGVIGHVMRAIGAVVIGAPVMHAVAPRAKTNGNGARPLPDHERLMNAEYEWRRYELVYRVKAIDAKHARAAALVEQYLNTWRENAEFLAGTTWLT